MPKLTDKQLGLADNPPIHDADPMASDKGTPAPRRRRVDGCAYCKTITEKGAPMHDASDRCESGKHTHCTCDLCY